MGLGDAAPPRVPMFPGDLPAKTAAAHEPGEKLVAGLRRAPLLIMRFYGVNDIR
jgi:hypothetical protein